MTTPTTCAECGTPLTPNTRGRTRRYCSPKCRWRASNAKRTTGDGASTSLDDAKPRRPGRPFPSLTVRSHGTADVDVSGGVVAAAASPTVDLPIGALSDPERSETLLTVPTGFNEFGRPVQFVKAESLEAAAHWDERLWRSA